jgi:hypothetical protein
VQAPAPTPSYWVIYVLVGVVIAVLSALAQRFLSQLRIAGLRHSRAIMWGVVAVVGLGAMIALLTLTAEADNASTVDGRRILMQTLDNAHSLAEIEKAVANSHNNLVILCEVAKVRNPGDPTIERICKAAGP